MLAQDLGEKRRQAQNRFLDFETALHESVSIRKHIRGDRLAPRPGAAADYASTTMQRGPAASARQLAALDVSISSQDRSRDSTVSRTNRRSSRRSASVPLILARIGGPDLIPEPSEHNLSARRALPQLPPLGGGGGGGSSSRSSAWTVADISGASSSSMMSVPQAAGKMPRQPEPADRPPQIAFTYPV